MRLDQLIDVDDLENEIKAGYVNRRFHPEFPNLAIVNYSDRCQFDQHWTATTRLTRGLIYDTLTGVVIARSFPKMFNLGDTAHTGELDPDMPIVGAFNKWDGSLGIIYERPDGAWAVATRGSFSSEQALHATALLQSALVIPNTGTTQLVEIVYPGNRIVLDYGSTDELVPLGSIDNETGQFFPARAHTDDTLGGNLRDVLAREPRPNAEGYVVWLNGTTAVKIKQEDYLALHRIVSSLTVKEVWRQLRADTFATFALALPDEFHDWALDTANMLVHQFTCIEDAAHQAHDRVVAGAFDTRKAQALWITANVPAHLRGFVFSLLDEKDLVDGVWRLVEPMGESPMRDGSTDAT